MKKITLLLLVASLLTGGTMSAFAADDVWAETKKLEILTGNEPAAGAQEDTQLDSRADLPGWAKEGFDVLNAAGLIPMSIARNNLSGPLTRLEYCEMIVPIYKLINGIDDSAIELVDAPYDDCESLDVQTAYSLGLIATAAEGKFDPTGIMTRQDMIYGIMSMLEKSGIQYTLTMDDLEMSAGYEDFADADSRIYMYLAQAVANGYISGEDETLIAPHNDATRAQLITCIGKIYSSLMEGIEGLDKPQITSPEQGMQKEGNFGINFEASEDAVKHYIIVKDTSYDLVDELSTLGNSVYIGTDYFVDSEDYTIIVADEYEDGRIVYSDPVSITYKKPYKTSSVSASETAAKRARVFNGGECFATAEEAAAMMQTVTVPVWKLASDGTKYASKQSVTVNKNLADDVVAIFTEIFEDDSQFPIKDIGGYNWRNTLGGSQSQHSFGTCIDINYNENYYVSPTGRALTGTLWEPYENPYSITPDGIVVRTFAKYGWLWGGNAWGDGYAKDYMHMTYLGG